VGRRPVAIYLLVNVLNIYADDADDVDDVDDVGDVGDVGDADLAKTLLPTFPQHLGVHPCETNTYKKSKQRTFRCSAGRTRKRR
jgi:hypothetical protein